MDDWKTLYILIKNHYKQISSQKIQKGGSNIQVDKIKKINLNVKKLNDLFITNVNHLNEINESNIDNLITEIKQLVKGNQELQKEISALTEEELTEYKKIKDELSYIDRKLIEL